jgi:hypothetical protein
MADDEENGESQQVKNATLKQSVQFLIQRVEEYHKEDKEWQDDEASWRDKIDMRMRTVETFMSSAVVQISILQTENGERKGEIKAVAKDIKLWDRINTALAFIAAALGIGIKQ